MRVGIVPVDICGAGWQRLRAFDNLSATISDHLDLHGVGPDDIVGLVEERTSETAIRVLGSRCGHLVSRRRSVLVRTVDLKGVFRR